MLASRPENQVARLADLQRHHSHTCAKQFYRGTPSHISVANIQSGQLLRFGVVWPDHVDEPQQSLGRWPCRRRIDDHQRSCFVGDLRRFDNRSFWDFVLPEENFGGAEQGSRSLYIRASKALIGSGRGQDLFLTVRIDHHQSHAGCSLALAADVADIDLFAAKIADRLSPAVIIANASNKRDTRAKPCTGHRLVCSFPTERLKERLAIDGFAWLRQRRSLDDKIGIRPANDDDIIFMPVPHSRSAKWAGSPTLKRVKLQRPGTGRGPE